MNRKMYWGIAALIVVLIAAGGFIYWQWSQVQQLKEEVAQDKKWLEEENKPVAENDLPTPDPGFKWVPHGDHFHEVPIDAPDVWQGDQHAPIVGGDVSTKELALPADEGKPLDEDFFRDNYSRGQIESMIKLDKETNERIQAVDIPFYEKTRKRYLELLQAQPDSEHFKKGLAEAEAEINRFKLIINNGEEMIALMSNVLNEEANNVEK